MKQVQTLANHTWEEASKHFPHKIKQLDFPVSGGGSAVVAMLPISCI
ncbi:alpha/beta hydrolase [Sodalis sp.]